MSLILFSSRHITSTVSVESVCTVRSQWNSSWRAAMFSPRMFTPSCCDTVCVISSRIPWRSIPSMEMVTMNLSAYPPQRVATSLEPNALLSLIALGQLTLWSTTFSSSSTNPSTSSPGIGEQHVSKR